MSSAAYCKGAIVRGDLNSITVAAQNRGKKQEPKQKKTKKTHNNQKPDK